MEDLRTDLEMDARQVRSRTGRVNCRHRVDRKHANRVPSRLVATFGLIGNLLTIDHGRGTLTLSRPARDSRTSEVSFG